MDNSFSYDEIMLDAPACALPDLRYLGIAAGMVVVALALALVVVKRLRTW